MLTGQFNELRGRLVCLRAFENADVTDDQIAWLNDPEVTRYSNQRFLQHSRETCRSYLASFSGTPNLYLSIRRLEDFAAIGTMTAYMSEHHQTVDIGIMVGNRDAWGKGFGQDAWNTLVNWFHADERVRKVTAGAMRGNQAMIRVMERSGMTLECIRPKQELLDGLPQDLCYFAKYRDTLQTAEN